jgi:DNA polymerase III alpha subunit (gram-positive type)
MSLHQRPNGTYDRRNSNVHANTGHRRYASSATTDEETLADEERYDTLQRINSDRDRYKKLYEQATKKLSEFTQSNTDYKDQILTLKEDNALLKKENENIKKQQTELEHNHRMLQDLLKESKAKLEHLEILHDGCPTQPQSSVRQTATVPDRTKHKDKDSREDRGRVKEKEKEREKKEQRAEKERLSKRFDEKKDSRPPVSNAKEPYREPMGPRSSSRVRQSTYLDTSSGRLHTPASSSSSRHSSHASVPRTPNTMNPPVLYSQSNGQSYYDANHEDGNYHPHPISR